ncbi:MAG TPA: enoyl-CoA hydratase-related protein, partial [Acidimicrobiales bacterium]|nr:enoyl-CoA hydratase-related protein [Acidimicrobiales bacterium]
MTGAGVDRVTCRMHDGVADVRLNRPDKLNALDRPMLEALATVGDDLREDRSVRAVVLSGEGRAFCAGLDRAVLLATAGQGPDDTGLADRIEPRLPGRITNLLQEVAWVWHELPVPTIAAVHGAAVGGGLQIALATDLRIVGLDARLAVLEIRWGIVPDMGGTHFLPRLVGVDRAKELTWTGREVGAAEAARIGLATRLADDPRAEARRLAAE